MDKRSEGPPSKTRKKNYQLNIHRVESRSEEGKGRNVTDNRKKKGEGSKERDQWSDQLPLSFRRSSWSRTIWKKDGKKGTGKDAKGLRNKKKTKSEVAKGRLKMK